MKIPSPTENTCPCGCIIPVAHFPEIYSTECPDCGRRPTATHGTLITEWMKAETLDRINENFENEMLRSEIYAETGIR